MNYPLPPFDCVTGLNSGIVQLCNEAIPPKFLDLKDGALVISLEQSVAGGGRAVTEHNVHDIVAVLDVSA